KAEPSEGGAVPPVKRVERPVPSTPEQSQARFIDTVLKLRDKGLLAKMAGRDAVLSLAAAAHDGRAVRGKFYRVMDPQEFAKWGQKGGGLPDKGLFKWAGPAEVVKKEYGQP